MRAKAVYSVSDFSGGQVDKVDSINLKDNQSPECQNVAITQYGALETRAGRSKINTTSLGSVAIQGVKVYKLAQDDLLTDGDLELWTGDVPNEWTVGGSTGTSAVTDEQSTTHNGSHAAKIDIDSSNNYRNLYQSLILDNQIKHVLTFYYHTEGTNTVKAKLKGTWGGGDYYLTSNGAWSISSSWFQSGLTSMGAYVSNGGFNFTTMKPYLGGPITYVLTIQSDASTSQHIFIDLISITKVRGTKILAYTNDLATSTGGTLSTSTGGDFSIQDDGLAENVIPDFLCFRDYVFIANGLDRVKKFQGDTISNVGLTQPDISSMTVTAIDKKETLRPDAAGDETDWAASAGNAYECVDEAIANGDTDYIIEDATGRKASTFQIANSALPTTVDIYDVTVVICARKKLADTGEPARIDILIRDDSTDVTYLRAMGPVWDTVYQTKWATWPTNPATGDAWTIADINDLEIGVRSYLDGNTTGQEVYVTQMYLAVRSSRVGNLDGEYKYKITYLSATTEGPGSPASDEITVEEGMSKLESIPTSGTSSRRIYRTGGIVSVYRLVGTIDNATTTDYLDDVADTDLGIELRIYGDPPPTRSKHIALYKERLWVARDKTLYPSDIDEEESFNLLNSIVLPIEETEEITGLHQLGEFLFIACSRSWWRLYGSSPDNWVLYNVTNDVGCSSNHSIVELRGSLVFLYEKHFYMLHPAGDLKKISEPLLDDELRFMDNQELCCGYHNEPEGYIEWSYSNNGCYNDNTIRWYYKTSSWYPGTAAFSSVDVDPEDFSIYFGEPYSGTGGFVYTANTCFDDAGSAIKSYWLSKRFNCGLPATYKGFRQLKLLARNSSQTKFVVYARYDFQTCWTTLGTVEYDSTAEEYVFKSYNLNAQRRYLVQFKFEATEVNKCLNLKDYSFVFQRFPVGRY